MKDDLAGQRFGRLVAVEPTKEKSKKASVYWRCRCDCGNEVEVTRDALLSGTQKSCGCLREGGGPGRYPGPADAGWTAPVSSGWRSANIGVTIPAAFAA